MFRGNLHLSYLHHLSPSLLHSATECIYDKIVPLSWPDLPTTTIYHPPWTHVLPSLHAEPGLACHNSGKRMTPEVSRDAAVLLREHGVNLTP
ncbi:unnamed protein product [Staurois parvus]|uniref:Uncharacterized protein n=1 Tax=Staurois parvus TaxID=386267 RepID=A0ABN9AS49_9NEOB|nr:unnamed protein product [Staurois parvus]